MDVDQALPASFYECDKHELAIQLIGRHLIRRVDGQLLSGQIVEVEVYGGPDDPASHANSGEPTQRTEAMFGPPGNAYIYQIYGIYHCLNVVAPAQQKAAAILIRALEPLEGRKTMARHRELDDKYDSEMPRSVERNLLSGPGKICQALRIDTDLDGTPLRDGSMWIAPGRPLVDTEQRDAVETTGRIGLNRETCGDSVDWPWRYIDSRSDFLSR